MKFCLSLILAFTCSPMTRSDDVDVVPIGWGVVGDGHIQLARIIETEKARYLFFSLGKEIHFRVGNPIDGAWLYSDPKFAIAPEYSNVTASDHVRCEYPSIVEGRFGYRFGKAPSRTFDYLMSYSGFDGRVWRTMFAVSSSLSGPWLKIGTLLQTHLEENSYPVQCSMVSERGGLVQLFFVHQSDGLRSTVRCRAYLSNLADPLFHPLEPICFSGMNTADGGSEPFAPAFADIAWGPMRNSYLMVRNVSETRFRPSGVISKYFGLDRIPTAKIVDQDASWETLRTLDGSRHNDTFIGMCGFVRDTTGQAVLDGKGNLQVLVTFQRDVQGRPDVKSGRIVEYRVPFEPSILLD
ncbi:MAG: hypothetical protein ABGZ53_14060 [Fuerstiella sp.]